jgi:hypothetical protein
VEGFAVVRFHETIDQFVGALERIIDDFPASLHDSVFVWDIGSLLQIGPSFRQQ